MLVIKLGAWSHAAKVFFVYTRIYTKNGKWTPFCMMKKRYKKWFGYFER